MTVEVSRDSQLQFPIKVPHPEAFIYEDDKCVVFEEDLKPQALEHFLVVPKKLIPRFTPSTDEDEKLLGELLNVARNVAIQRGMTKSGFHVIMDEDYQKKRLSALHVFGRALHHMLWPMGPGGNKELRLQWVPAHIGLKGNEEADQLAKRAPIEGSDCIVLSCYFDYLAEFIRTCYKKWKEYFDQRSLEKAIWYKTIQCQPLHSPWFCDKNIINNKIK